MGSGICVSKMTEEQRMWLNVTMWRNVTSQ